MWCCTVNTGWISGVRHQYTMCYYPSKCTFAPCDLIIISNFLSNKVVLSHQQQKNAEICVWNPQPDYLPDSHLLQWVFFVDLLFLFGHRDPAGRIRPTRNTPNRHWLWIDKSILSVASQLYQEPPRFLIPMYTHLTCAYFSQRCLRVYLVSLGGQACCWVADLQALYWLAAVNWPELMAQLEAEWEKIKYMYSPWLGVSRRKLYNTDIMYYKQDKEKIS